MTDIILDRHMSWPLKQIWECFFFLVAHTTDFAEIRTS